MMLAGMRILVLDDEPLITMDITEILEAAGAIVLPTMKLEDAIHLALTDHPTAAVLDFRLGMNVNSTPLANMLSKAGVPFIFYTSDVEPMAHHPGVLVITKPASPSQLIAAIRRSLK